MSGATTPGTFFSFLTALLMAYQSIKSLASLNATLQMAMGVTEEYLVSLIQKPFIIEKTIKNSYLKNSTTIAYKIFDVTFAYEKAQKKVIIRA